ncbi:MAG: hypothetical protein M3362_26955, partial [Acidobacteriota bacterium]|nr:hypothetical protein [Acidobacteriota bacterium]
MKTSLFSEEGRAARGGRGPLAAFLIVWGLISVFGGYQLFRHHTIPNLTPLQRVYLPQYRHSFFRSTFTPFNPQSTYWILDRKVIDPKTKLAVVLGCTEDMV